MKIDELNKVLEKMHSLHNARMVAHWLKHVSDNDEAIYKDEKDVAALKRIEELGLLETKQKDSAVEAKLTESGKELHREFLWQGWYG